jgi:predicted alpha-1,2-mannosidase
MTSHALTRRELLKELMAALGASVIVDGAVAVTSAAARSAAGRGEDLVALVNPMQGTNSDFGFSRGNTLPLVSLPFGLTHWSLQTSEGSGWFFNPGRHEIQGIRATHQPSPWMGDYGHFTVMAQSGELVAGPAARAAAYDPAGLQIGPHRLSVGPLRDGTRIEMTPTERCAAFRFTFPAGKTGRILIDAHSLVDVDAEGGIVTGCSRLKSGGTPEGFGCYFYARFDRPVSKAYALGDDRRPADRNTLDGKNVGAAIEFEGQTAVVMTVSTSFISADQARRNLEREIGSRTFEAVQAGARAAWNRTLNVVRVAGGTERQRRTFYTCLYRAHLFPRMFHEYDESGAPIHYSAFDGKVHPGVMYTDTGLWDGYHTLYPLLSLLQPERLGEIVQGFVNASVEGGWLPQWPSPGYRGSMGGTHSDAVIAEAILKGIPGFDRAAAYAGLRKNATVSPGLSTEGRHHLDEYVKLGYVPGSISDTLDYAYDDACVAMAARFLGHDDDAALFGARALNYRNVYDASVGFMRCRNADGSWKANFDPYAWGDGYTEGGPWQWIWSAPHDPAGLIALMDGREAFLRKLDRMLWQPPIFHPGGYGGTIHEMKEMAAVPFGQYAQSNQPSHQVLPLYAAAGRPERMHYWARRVLDELYSPDDLPGDEDNGEMASWYVLMALGLFPGCPGRPSYTLGSPQFRDAWIALPGGKTLHIHAPARSPKDVYVAGVKRDGHAWSKLWIAHADLVRGGRLDFAMAERPATRAIASADLPDSLTPYGDDALRAVKYGLEIAINCGGSDAAEYVGDCYYEGGAAATFEGAGPRGSVDTSVRQGDFVYRIPVPMPP